MDVNHAIDESIDNPEPLEPNPPRSEVLYHKSEEDLDHLRQVGGGFGSSITSRRRIWIVYDKSDEDLDRLPQVRGGFGSSMTSRRRIWIVYYKSEEDLDRLLQVEEGLASIHRRAPVPADYSDFINNAIPLPNGYRGLMAPQSWSGGPGHWKTTSPPSYPAHPNFFGASILVGRARALEGHESSKLPSSAHRFLPQSL
jgi:hypothetical protein